MRMSVTIFRRFVVIISILLLTGSAVFAGPSPTHADVAYGAHTRDVLDFWQAKSSKPTPLVIYIHGGGFYLGDKTNVDSGEIATFLSKGVSCASISYPYYVDVPLQGIIRDHIARAVQFLRYKAKDWNIDKTKIAVYGESAGAGSSLWLAVHDDLADPGSKDPVLRESSRVAAAGAIRTQATYDFVQWPDVFAGVVDQRTIRLWQMLMGKMVLDMNHLKSEKEMKSKAFEPVRRDLDMLSMMDKNDSPVYMRTLLSEQNGGDMLHHPAHAYAVKKQCDTVGMACVLVVDETPASQRISVVEFLIGQLK